MRLELGNVVFEQGRPQVAVSLTGTNPVEIVNQCREAVKHPVQIIEWRADYYFAGMANLQNKLVDKDTYIDIIKILDDIDLIADGRPVIFTIRTTRQGGQADLTDAQIASVQEFVAGSGFVDLIDVEVTGPNPDNGGIDGEQLEARVAMIHDNHCKVILSYHDFDGMPEPETIVRILAKMKADGADMAKMAAMAHTKEDALAMTKATAYLTKKGIGPVVTMAMGKEGMITRVVGGKYGSVMTFAAVGNASAPGQISADIMKEKLDEYYGA